MAGFVHARPRPRLRADAGRFRRDEALARLASESFDVLVIGGGITGAGVALDAASRGLKTALVEKDDFASGTSSKSSKLVHGGLRYLQQNEFRLVYENLAERQRLLDNAPHLVSPLPFLIPLFGRDGVVNRGVARVYRTALWLYDLTGGVRIGRRHEKVTRAQALAHMPNLQADRLVAGFLYWDARTDDARLTLTVLRTAVLDHGAVAANHAPVTALTTGADGRVDGATVTPDDGPALRCPTPRWWSTPPGCGPTRCAPSTRSGTRTRSGRPRASTSPCPRPPSRATSPPSSRSGRTAGRSSWCRGVTRSTSGPPTPSGTGPLDDPSCLPEDVDYILDAANAITTTPIGRADITGIWAGLRPLLAPVEGRHAPSERTADLSRRHTVRTSPEGMVTVTGGKLTTYRKMAEDTVDAALGGARASGRSVRDEDPPAARGHGPARPGPGARGLGGRADGRRRRADPAQPPCAAHLAGRYGTETPAVLAVADGRPELLDPLVPGLHYLAAEAVYAVRGGDGPLGGRRARPADPGLPARRPRRGRRGRPGGRPHRPLARAGTTTAPSRRRRRTPAMSGRELVRAGLDPNARPVHPRPSSTGPGPG